MICQLSGGGKQVHTAAGGQPAGMHTLPDRNSFVCFAAARRCLTHSLQGMLLALVPTAPCISTSTQEVHITPGTDSSAAGVTSQRSLREMHNLAIRVNVELALAEIVDTREKLVMRSSE